MNDFVEKAPSVRILLARVDTSWEREIGESDMLTETSALSVFAWVLPFESEQPESPYKSMVVRPLLLSGSAGTVRRAMPSLDMRSRGAIVERAAVRGDMRCDIGGNDTTCRSYFGHSSFAVSI